MWCVCASWLMGKTGSTVIWTADSSLAKAGSSFLRAHLLFFAGIHFSRRCNSCKRLPFWYRHAYNYRPHPGPGEGQHNLRH